MSVREARRRCAANELTRLHHGIYIRPGDDADDLIRRHAARLAAYIYPGSYLSRESAFRRGIASDGRIYINHSSRYRGNIAGIEFVVEKSPLRRQVEAIEWRDDMGDIVIRAASPLQTLAECLAAKDGLDNSICLHVLAKLRQNMADRDIKNEINVLFKLNGWRYPNRIESLLKISTDHLNDTLHDMRSQEMPSFSTTDQQYISTTPLDNESSVNCDEFIVSWHNAPIGKLFSDGVAYSWKQFRSVPFRTDSENNTGLPTFIENLLPEGMAGQALRSTDLAFLRRARRYMSNISIAPDADSAVDLPHDMLTALLKNHCSPDGRFTGRFGAGLRGIFKGNDFNPGRAGLHMVEGIDQPTISGMQSKGVVCLMPSGTLDIQTGRPGSHILKLPAPTAAGAGFEIGEWAGLCCAAAIGLETPACALVEIPEMGASGLLVERFDVRRTPLDSRFLFTEEFTTALGLPATRKNGASWEDAAMMLAERATYRAEALDHLYRRAALSWLFGDNDCHLKNLALLSSTTMNADHDGKPYTEIHLAPAYDITSAVGFTSNPLMHLPINGKRGDLTVKDFHTFGKLCKLNRQIAESTLECVAQDIIGTLNTIIANMPQVIDAPQAKELIERILDLSVHRAAALGFHPRHQEITGAPDGNILANKVAGGSFRIGGA